MNSTPKPQPGSVNLSQPDLFQAEKLTSDQFAMCRPRTCGTSPKGTGTPASEAGPGLYSSPAGQPTGLLTPCPAPARHSLARERKSSARSAVENPCPIRTRLESLLASHAATNGLPMPGTSGLSRAASSSSCAQQLALESRLRERTDLSGSPEYVLRWKNWGMVLGSQICALRASARHTSDSDCTGWPTPVAGATTPACHGQMSGDYRRQVQKIIGGGWPTPSSRDWKDTPGMSTTGTNPDGTERTRLDQLPRVAQLASGWPTPRAEDSESTGAHRGSPDTLTSAVRLAGWATPDANAMNLGEGLETWDARQARNKAKHKNGNGAGMPLAIQSQTISGPPSTLSPAGTEKRGGSRSLNPFFSLWLMGFPVEWALCGIRAAAKMKRKKTKS